MIHDILIWLTCTITLHFVSKGRIDLQLVQGSIVYTHQCFFSYTFGLKVQEHNHVFKVFGSNVKLHYDWEAKEMADNVNWYFLFALCHCLYTSWFSKLQFETLSMEPSRYKSMIKCVYIFVNACSTKIWITTMYPIHSNSGPNSQRFFQTYCRPITH